jgi:DNA-binding NtrC family response regulator
MRDKIVVIDDESSTLKQIRRILEKEGYQVAAFSNPHHAENHLHQFPCDLVISDIKMPGIDGLELMGKIRSRFPDIDFIFITGYASLDGAVEAAKEGAYHYLSKPFNPDQLRQKVGQAISRRKIKRESRAAAAREDRSVLPVLIGQSHRIRHVEAMVRQVAGADCNVLITGESGTGKELVARMLHALSPRAAGPFVAFNCGALTETLITNELFGHEKGAFTGAESSTPGLIETAGGGTLFLDEIGEVSYAMQVNLLRVIQEKELVRVGGRRPIDLDVRMVSATSKNLKALVDGGSMRSDFFYRINVFNIELPAMREHLEDVPLLAYHILNRIQARGGTRVEAISRKAMELLRSYAFPGNVRELENILERAVAVCNGHAITLSDLPPDLISFQLHTYKRPEDPLMTLEELEQDYIAHVLKITHGVRVRAAEILGIDRASLWRKLKKYNLE